jgi:hypothetical protein
MRKEPPRVPAFAAFLREKRGKRSRESVVTQLQSVGVHIRGGTLHRYEDEARLPSIDVLRGLSAVYRVPFEEVVDRVLRELEVKTVPWGDQLAQEFPAEAIEVASAYVSAPEHVQSGIRSLLQLPKPEEVPRPQPRAVVGERARKKKPHLSR